MRMKHLFQMYVSALSRFLVLAGAFLLVSATTEARTLRTADFLDTIGVNTHIGTDPYQNPGQIASMLSYLGIGNVRQTSPTTDQALADMQALGRSGAKIAIIVNGGGPVDLKGAMRTVVALAPYLNAVEGVNEAAIWPISYGALSGIDAVIRLQKDLYAAVHANAALAGVPVYMFTLGGVDPGAFPQIGDMSAYTDYANIHSYPPHGLRPIFVIHAAIDGGRTDAPSKPIVLTETGYYTLPQNNGWGGVPESMQASYIVDLLLDEAAAGVSRTYLYDLIDDGADPAGTDREAHFGLFRYDGSTKPSAAAIHNLTAILADAGAAARSFAPPAITYTAAGVPYNYTGNTLALAKSDGTRLIAVWNEQQLWDPDTQTATAAKNFPVSVDLGQTYAIVRLYDPIVGSAPIETLFNVRQVSFDLADHPFIIEIPPSATTGSTTAPATITLTGSRPVLTKGDGDYIVSGSTGGATVILGNGNDTVTLGGWANTITLGTGTSTVTTGLGYASVTAGGGHATIIAPGNGNRIDVGSGTNEIRIDRQSVHNRLTLSGPGGGVTTIRGFDPGRYDTLDLTRVLAGTGIGADLSRLTRYVTASTGSTGTMLFVDTSGGGGTARAFAQLDGITTSVAALVAKGSILLS